MKRWMIGAVMASLAVSMLGCTTEETPKVDTPVAESPIVDETPAIEVLWGLREVLFDNEAQAVSYTVFNDSEMNLGYGLAFRIERLSGSEEWEDTGLTDEMAWIAILMVVEAGQSAEDSMDLSEFDIPTGTYRIVREYLDEENTFAGIISFTVDEDLAFDNFESEVEIREALPVLDEELEEEEDESDEESDEE